MNWCSPTLFTAVVLLGTLAKTSLATAGTESSTGRINCDVSSLTQRSERRMYDLSLDSEISSHRFKHNANLDPISYTISVEPGSKDEKRGYRITLTNRLLRATGNLNGKLSELRSQNGAKLRLLDGPSREIRIHCSLY